MLSLSLRSLSVLGLSVACAATSAQATILTFNMGVANGTNVLQSYGDRVGDPGVFQPPGFQYGGLADPTPKIIVDYFGALRLSDDANLPYGNLERVLYRVNEGSGTGTMMEFVLSSIDPMFTVRLNSFDLAARLNLLTNPPQEENIPVRSIRVLDGPGNVLFQRIHPTNLGDGASNPILNPGTLIPGTMPLRRNVYDFGPNGLIAPIIRIQIDVGQILTKMERIGIDNINFSQVPAPGAAGVLAGVALMAARRRRNR